MSSRLGGVAPDKEGDEGGDQAGEPESQHTIKPERNKAGEPARKRRGTSAETGTGEDKLKVTFYVSQDVADRLEEAWMKLRLMASKETRTSISKSGIVERAVEEALDELERKGEKSRLGRSLLG